MARDPNPGPEGPQEFAGYPRGAAAPRVRTEAIGEAFKLFGQAPWTYIGAALPTLVATLVYAALSITHQLLAIGFPTAKRLTPGEVGMVAVIELGLLLAYSLVFYLNLGGLTRMALRQLRGLPIRVSDAFVLEGMGLQISLLFVVTFLAVSVGFMVCIVPGLIVDGFLMLSLPIMMDRRVSAFAAMRESWSVLRRSMWSATFVLFLASMVLSFSGNLCLVGILVGLPFYALVQAIVYRDFYYPVAAPYAAYEVNDRTPGPPPEHPPYEV